MPMTWFEADEDIVGHNMAHKQWSKEGDKRRPTTTEGGELNAEGFGGARRVASRHLRGA